MFTNEKGNWLSVVQDTLDNIGSEMVLEVVRSFIGTESNPV